MKFQGILICTDLDGTLLRKDKTVSPENLEAIDYFKARGGLFTLITGRMPYFISNRGIYEAVKPNAPIGCINGGGIYDLCTGKYFWTQELARSALTLAKYTQNIIPEIGVQVNTFDAVYFCKESSAMETFRKITGTPNIPRRYEEIREPIAKIVFGDHNEQNILQLQRLLGEHPLSGDFDFIRSEKMLYEILPKGICKGTALKKLAQILHIPKTKTVAVGDYHNDISMLREAGLGVAVANATPEAQAAADYITVSNEEHAIAALVSDLESGKIRL